MFLRELIEDLKEKDIKGSQDIEVRGIANDSRQVEEGFLFVSIPGFNFDGHAFIPEAIKRGACGVVVEKDIKLPGGTAIIKVANARYALGILANKFYDHPSGKFRLIGIAGTNGKTTTTHLVREILREAGQRTALLGTIAYELGSKTLPAPWTTPPSLELQSIFQELVKEKIDYVVMEVTSHALELDRLAGCDFDVGVFTNSTRDHLDFHKTMKNYLEAKTKLFGLLNHSPKTQKRAIINIDDPSARYVIKKTRVQILTYAIEKEADIRAYDITFSWNGLKFNVTTPLGKTPIFLPLLGRHNVYNTLAAIGVGISEGISLNEIRQGLAKSKNVSGRFERIDCGQLFSVVVDYAHTPDALQKALETARELARARVLVVFGCGGDRDRGKRLLMGEVAATHSDIIILTSDNPRNEAPLQIIKEIGAGVKPSSDYLIIEDRFEAIKKALALARKDDLVLLAGKGHENEQIIKGKSFPFNDREVVKGLLTTKGG